MAERIALIGNCQIGPIRKALRFLAPQAGLSLIWSASLGDHFRNIKHFSRRLMEYDVIFCQDFNEDSISGGGSEVLAQLLPQLVRFPMIVFPAFHPDIVYAQLKQEDGQLSPLASPMGDYHSSLILYGYMMEFTPAQTRRLFDEEILRRVGFLDVWSPAQEELLAAGRKVSMPLEKDFMNWVRQGCFMHSINHPRLFVLSDIARTLLRRANVPFRGEDPGPFLIDDMMRNVVWPVYPAIARSLGFTGGHVFKKVGVNVFCDLDEFITESYSLYAQFGRGKLLCQRIDLWRRDQELDSFIRSHVAN